MVIKRGRGWSVTKSTKGDRCYPVFSLRCRGTCLGHEIWKREEQEEEGEVDAFSSPALVDGDSDAVGDGGDENGSDKGDNRNRRT